MAAPTIPLIREEEYLNTSYEPDCEFVDGVLLERAVGTFDHGLLQALVVLYLGAHCERLRFLLVTECRTRIRKSRYRIPDVMLVSASSQGDKFFDGVPLAVIEILSPDDRMKSVLSRLQEFDQLGVENIVVLDPEDREAFKYDRGSLTKTEFRSLKLPAGDLPFSTAELFERLAGAKKSSEA